MPKLPSTDFTITKGTAPRDSYWTDAVNTSVKVPPVDAPNQQEVLNKQSAVIETARENASFSDKYFGMSNIFDGTGFSHVIDYFKYNRGFTRNYDKKFISTFNKEKEDIFLKAYGLDESSRSVLREAKNQEMLYDLAEQEQKRKQSADKVQLTYNDTEQVVGNLAVSLATDPSVLLSGGAVALVKGAKALYKVEEANAAVKSFTALNAVKTTKSLEKTATELSKGKINFQHLNDLESGAKIVDTMKNVLAKTVVGTNVAYGAVLGATDKDTSMLEGLISYGLLSPLDYKIINGIKVLDRFPRASSLGKNTVDYMHKQDSRLAPLTDEYLNHPKAYTKDYKFSIEKKIDKDKTLSSIDKQELKARITAKLKTAKSPVVRKFLQVSAKIRKDLEIAKAKTKKINTKLVNKAKELKITQTHFDDIEELSKDIEMHIADVKKSIEIVGKTEQGQKDIALDMMNLYRGMHEQGYLSKSAIDQIEYSFKKGKGKTLRHPKFEVTSDLTKEGKPVHKLKINGKVVKVGGGIVLASLGLNASEGDGSSSTPNIGLIIGLSIAGLALGIPLGKKLYSEGFKNTAKQGFKFINKAKTLDETRPLRTKLGSFVNESRTTVTETTKPMLDNTKGKVHELAQLLYYNPLDTLKQTIEMTKRFKNNAFTEGLEREFRPFFNDWLNGQNLSKIQNVASMFTDMSLRAKFNKKVWEYMTQGLNSEDKSVVGAAKKTEEYYQQIRQDLIDSGVKNADKIFKVTDSLMYVPRIHKGLVFANKIVGISEASRRELINRFASILTKTPEKRRLVVAEQYIENMIKGGNKEAKSFSKNSREELKKELATKGLDEDEIDEVISTISGSFGRTKARLHMDYSKFGTVDANINGASVPLTIDDLFETDTTSIFNAYSNQSSGHIALATNNFKSIDDALSIVEEASKKGEIPPAYKNTITNDLKATVGIPNVDYSQTMNVVMKNLGNMAIGKMMVYSTLSLPSEGLVYIQNVLSRAGLFKGMKDLADNVRKFGDDSFVASDVPFGKDGLGLAQSRYGASFGQFRTFDEFSNQNSGLGRWTKFSEVWRDFTLHTLPFTRTSDFIAKANLQDVMDRLYAHINGSKPFKSYELSAFPITPKMEKYLKDNLELNKQGHVKSFDYTKAPYATKDEFKNLINNIMMKRMNQTTMGTSGAYSRQSAVGVAMSAMLKFPMSAYSNLGGFLGRGTLQGDSFAMIQTALWFQAGVVQTVLRKEAEGQDYTEEDLIVGGIINMPPYGVLGTGVGISNSPTMNMANKLSQQFDIYNYVNEH